MHRNLHVIAMLLTCFCLTACDWQEEVAYSQVYADNGIKFGGTFIYINGSVTSLEIIHGIDSSNLHLKLAECSGISIEGTYTPFTFLGNFKSDLTHEFGKGIYSGTSPGSFIFVRDMPLPEGAVNKTTLNLTAQNMKCGLSWFRENVVLYN